MDSTIIIVGLSAGVATASFIYMLIRIKEKDPIGAAIFFCLIVWNGYTVYSNTIRPQIGDYRVECTKVEFVATEVAAPKPQAEEKLFEETCGKFSWQVYTKDSNGNKVWVDAD